MLLLDDFNLTILLPWKSASQTLRSRLDRHDRSPYPAHFYYNAYLRRVVHQHLTVADLKLLPEGNRNKLAVFVRNPYDRAYSGFIQIQRDIDQQFRMSFPQKWIADLVREQLSENLILLQRAQFDFNKWIYLLDPYLILECGRNTNMPLHPAHYWTHLNGEDASQFIGKVETFEKDFDKLCSIFNIFDKGNDDHNRSNQDDIETNPHEYRHLKQLDAKSIDKINDLFADDFRLFGYGKIDSATM